MTSIADEKARRRFASELDANFSVIASAGSGKTRAITDRIVEIASDQQRAADRLPQLVVVTTQIAPRTKCSNAPDSKFSKPDCRSKRWKRSVARFSERSTRFA